MKINAKVSRIWNETSEIRCLELVPDDAAVLGQISPGAHADVFLGEGLSRQYSLWNGPEERQSYLIGVKKEPQSRGGSVAVHALSVGDTVQVSAPINHFPLADGPGPHLLMAGGIGITPLLAMAQMLAAQGRAYHLHVFARSEEHLPFADMLAKDTNATAHLGVNPPEWEWPMCPKKGLAVGRRRIWI